MDTIRSPFLNGALAWIGNGTIRDRCDLCAFDWTTQSATAVDAIAAAPDRYAALLAGWDPDELATARNYRNLPTVPALWALDQATASFVDLSRQLDHATPFQHGDWGAGTVADGLRWLAHEYTHHLLDVEARAR